MKSIFDLQHFATATIETGNTLASTDPTYLNTNTTKSEGMSVENKTFYDKLLIRMAGPKLVHDEDADERDIPANNGKIIEFRHRKPLKKAMQPLVEGLTPDGNTLVFENKTTEVNQYGDYVVISDILDMTALDPVLQEAVMALGDQAGQTLDTVTRNVMHQTTNVKYVDKVVSGAHTKIEHRYDLDANASLTVEEIMRGVTFLKAKNTPTFPDGTYHAIVHPFAVFDLMRDPEFQEWHKYAKPEELLNGEIGRIGGVRFKESTEAKIFYGADLASDSRTLTVNGQVTSGKTINFDGGTVAAHALKGRFILVGGTQFEVDDNTTSAITTKEAVSATIADNTVIYPGEGGKEGTAVLGTLLYGKGAYAKTKLANGGMETIIKQRGAGEDRLNQRASAGWKATRAATILVPEYLMRIESVSPRYSATVTEEN